MAVAVAVVVVVAVVVIVIVAVALLLLRDGAYGSCWALRVWLLLLLLPRLPGSFVFNPCLWKCLD